MNTTKSFPNLLNEALEISSNISDNNSECLSSSLSSLSGLTGYEEELSDLKHLIKLSPNSTLLPYQITRNSNGSTNKQIEAYEEQINKLNSELHDALKSKEQYKNDMSNLQRKIELDFHEKFERLLKNNARLEGQLLVSKEHIKNLLSNKNVANNSATNKLVELELEYTSKIDLLENEVKHWKKEVATQDALNNQFKIELEEVKINLNGKNNSIEALKKKIVDLHVDMQNLNQESVRITNLLSMTSNELEAIKKSELWYKEQLHQCRQQKFKSSEEISKLQLSLAAKERNLDLVNSDLNKLKYVYEQFQLNMLQEKQGLLKTIDKLSSANINHGSPPKVISIVDENLSRNYELTIESLTKELMTIKQAINEHQSTFEALNKQNSELVARNTILQKTLNDKEIFIGNLEYEKKDLNMKIEISTKKQNQTEQLIMNLMNEKSTLEIALNAADREKTETQGVVAAIRENFSKFLNSYNRLKEELNEKNRELLKNDIIIKEMNGLKENNRKLNSQAENGLRLINDLKVIEETNGKLKSEVISHQETIELLKEELDMLKQNLIATLSDLSAKDEVINKLKCQITNESQLKSEVITYQETINDLRKEIEMLKENLKQFTNELKSKDNTIQNQNAKINNLKSEVISLEMYPKTIDALKNEIDTLKLNLSSITNDLNSKDTIIQVQIKEINDMKSEVTSISESKTALEYSINEANQLNKLLKVENYELNDKLSKFVTNNFNGFNTSRVNRIEQNHLEKINELEGWFLNVLDAILAGLNKIKSCTNLNQFCLTNENEKFKNHLEAISNSLVHFEKFYCNKKLIKRKVFQRLKKFQDKVYLLEKQQEKDLLALEDLKSARLSLNETKFAEEIKQLKILVKAKELENKEKQKRYETNNRTLLKKVKEHMRGRNASEKHCTYLQELHNNVSDELNSYKLRDSSKDSEIQNLQNLCENYKNINNKLKQDILGLQKELSILKAEKDLIDYESLQKNVANLENKLKETEENVKQKDIIINKLQMEIQEMSLKKAALEKEKLNYTETTMHLDNDLNMQNDVIVNLKSLLEKDREALEDSQEKLLMEQKQHAITMTHFQSIQQTSQHVEEKNNLLNEEIESLNHRLDCNNNELNDLKAQKILSDKEWMEKQDRMQTFITCLQSEIQVLQNDLLLMKSDKDFLQKLCNDLKIALETCMNQSKVLKQQMQTLTSVSTREYNSLPDPSLNLPSPSKYDEEHIKRLLKQSGAPLADKPLSDLEKCLNSLKQEMICLRKQVTEGISYQI